MSEEYSEVANLDDLLHGGHSSSEDYGSDHETGTEPLGSQDPGASQHGEGTSGTPGEGPDMLSKLFTTLLAPSEGGGGSDFMGMQAMSDSIFGEGPMKDHWLPDDCTETCMQCDREFTIKRRRHHCRMCGRIFCKKCSLKRMALPAELRYTGLERVCDSCAEHLEVNANL